MRSILKFLIIGVLLLYGCAEKKEIVVQEDVKKVTELTEAMEKFKDLVQKAVGAILEQAKTDVSEARKAGAEKYAPELLGSAEDSLVKAIESYEAKEYDKTLNYALKATTDAKAAKGACEAGKLTKEKQKPAKKNTKNEQKTISPSKKTDSIEKKPTKTSPNKGKKTTPKEEGKLYKMDDMTNKAIASTKMETKEEVSKGGFPIFTVIIVAVIMGGVIFLSRSIKKKNKV